MNNNVLVEVDKNNREIIEEILSEYPGSGLADSFGIESIVYFLIPIMAFLQPVATKLIDKLIVNDYVTIKYNGYELSGSYKNVQKMIREIQKDIDNHE